MKWSRVYLAIVAVAFASVAMACEAPKSCQSENCQTVHREPVRSVVRFVVAVPVEVVSATAQHAHSRHCERVQRRHDRRCCR